MNPSSILSQLSYDDFPAWFQRCKHPQDLQLNPRSTNPPFVEEFSVPKPRELLRLSFLKKDNQGQLTQQANLTFLLDTGAPGALHLDNQ